MQKLIGKSDKIKKLLEFIDLIKDRNTTVLITGELGTGKELVAQRIHRTGSRRDAQLCIVDSGCITETIAGSELFGHREGSFTGATKDHKGKFESAQDGTIVLDEIGNMDYRTQAMLLRVLENRTFQKVGSSKTTQTNARVVAVTNKDLHKMVDDGTFRGDLLSRLFVFHIEVPPLRERKEDIPELSMYFLKYFC